MSKSTLTDTSRSAGPLQAQVRDRIAAMIADDTLAPGTALPPFRELAKQLGTSVTPLHRAIRELAATGLVEVRQGSGVRIAPRRPAASLREDTPPRAVGTIAVISRMGAGNDDTRWKHRMVTAFERVAVAHGHRVLFYDQVGPDGVIRPLYELAREAVTPGGVDAFAIIEPIADATAQEAVSDLLHRMECSHVFVSGGANRGPYNSVYYDSEWAGYIAARHVCQQGHRRIAMPLLTPDDWGDAVRFGQKQGWIAERFAGAARACRAYDAELIPLRLVTADLGESGPGGVLFPHGMWRRIGEPVARRLAELSGPAAPTAVITLNDEMAMCVITRLREAGLRVPEDIGVAGFDNLEEGRAFHLTTVEPPIEELGREAALLLDRLISAGPTGKEQTLPVQHILVKPTLVQRGSVLPRRAASPPSDGKSVAADAASAAALDFSPRLAAGLDRGEKNTHRTHQTT